MFPLHIEVVLKDKRWEKRLRRYRACAKEAAGLAVQAAGIDYGNCEGLELSVVLGNDAFIKELNRRFRGKPKPTNVLSFPNMDVMACEFPPQGEHLMLGDVILAFETIEKEARAQGKEFKDHTVHLIIHGVLHLLGYDHEEKREAEKMENLEVRVLKQLGIGDPYV